MVNKTPEELEQWRQIEQALLGSILPNGDCLDKIAGITAKSFQSDKHRLIWAAIEALQNAAIPINAITVAEHLSQKGKFSEAGGEAYLFDLMNITPNLQSVPYFVEKLLKIQRDTEILLKLDVVREAIKCGQSEEAARGISDIQHINDQATKQRFEFLTAEELITGEFEHNWLINGVLVSNQLCVFAAQKKCLKTNLSIEMAFCLATGVPFLDKFPIPKVVNVAMIIGESGKATTQETFRRIAISKGWSGSQVENLHFCFDLPSLDKAEDIQQLRRIVKELEIKVLFLDPAYLCLKLGDSAKSLFSVGEKLKHLLQLGDETDCTIIIIHHMRKSNGINTYAVPELEEIAYAGFQEIARQWVLLGRRAPYRPDEAGIHKLYFVAGGSAGHSQLWALDINEGSIENKGGRIWETRLFSEKEADAEKQNAKEQRKLEERESREKKDMQKVLNVLQSAKKPLTASNVRDEVKLSTPRNKAALKSLVESGDISCEMMKGGNGKPTDHYSIVAGSAGYSGIEEVIPLSHSAEHRERDSAPCKGGYPTPVCASEIVSEQRKETDYPVDFSDVFPPDDRKYT